MKFQGFTNPHTTPVPDQFFDLLLAEIDNLAELKVLLYILRRTFGFGKLVDRVSYSQLAQGIKTRRGVRVVQLDRGTGLSRPSIIVGLRKALAHGYLVRYIVCPHCDQEVSQLEEVERQGSKVKVAPQHCPHCEQQLRGREQFYYGLPLLSTELSTLGKDVTYPYLKFFTRGGKEFLPALGKLLNPQETDKQETDKQETSIQETDNKQAVAVVVHLLSDFGFESNLSEAIAEETLEAGLTAEDVEEWIEYVRGQENLTNPKGFLRAKLRRGVKAPSDEDEPERYRYIRGKYADYIKH